MKVFNRSVKVYKNYFWDFYDSQPMKVQDKIDWTIGLVQSLKIVPKNYFDHVVGSDGIWEIRTNLGNNIYRVFCCFD